MREKGQGFVEYALILILVAFLVVIALILLGATTKKGVQNLVPTVQPVATPTNPKATQDPLLDLPEITEPYYLSGPIFPQVYNGKPVIMIIAAPSLTAEYRVYKIPTNRIRIRPTTDDHCTVVFDPSEDAYIVRQPRFAC